MVLVLSGWGGGVFDVCPPQKATYSTAVVLFRIGSQAMTFHENLCFPLHPVAGGDRDMRNVQFLLYKQQLCHLTSRLIEGFL